MIQLVVFDMAGTVVDEQNLVYKIVHRSVEKAGFEVDFSTVLRLAAGKEKRAAIAEVLTSIQGQAPGDKLLDSIFEDFKVSLEEGYKTEPVLAQPGAEKLFKSLQAKGVKVVLNTGYDRKTAEYLCSKLGWSEGSEIDYLITASDVVQSRPHPDMIELAMEKCGVSDASTVLKVGDSIIDIEEGRNAGASSLGITTGAHTREQLDSAEPDGVVDHLEEVEAWIAQSVHTN